MIVRILGEGQFDVPDDALKGLNQHDEEIIGAVAAGDEATFRRALTALVAGVREAGRPLDPSHLGGSHLILPGPDATIEEVRSLLSEDGLVPG